MALVNLYLNILTKEIQRLNCKHSIVWLGKENTQVEINFLKFSWEPSYFYGIWSLMNRHWTLRLWWVDAWLPDTCTAALLHPLINKAREKITGGMKILMDQRKDREVMYKYMYKYSHRKNRLDLVKINLIFCQLI